MGLAGASNRDIAAVLGCDEGTIRNRCSALLRKKRAERRIAIHEAQQKAIAEGNPTMLVWMGKVVLKQVEKMPKGSKPTGLSVTINNGRKNAQP